MTLGTKIARNGDGLSVLSSSVVSQSSTGSLPWVLRPKSGNGFCRVSFRKIVPSSHEAKSDIEQTVQGRKYGYFLRNSLELNSPGYCSAGHEREPPTLDPICGEVLCSKKSACCEKGIRHTVPARYHEIS